MPVNLDFNSYFKNQSIAIALLVDILPKQRMQDDDWLIIAINEQSIEMANIIASKFNLSFDLLFTQKISTPNNDECTVAMVSETQEIVIQEELMNSFTINLDYIYGQAHRLFEKEIIPKVYQYKKGELINSIEGRNILFVDVSCETGLGAISCTKTAIKLGASSIMYSTPIMASDVHEALQRVVDEIFCPKKIDNFVNVDFYYKSMQTTKQNDIIEVLNNSKRYLPFSKNRSDNGI
ncbi:MAG: sodium:proton antiporter [Epsilonproteobacteria bacterium]|nr:sodium:proton antiporter [Campylobacterota bacterium]